MASLRTPFATLALAAAACTGGPSLGESGPEAPDSIVVEAFNDHFYDARIHAVYAGGQRRTLGTIVGNGGHAEKVLEWEPHALVFEIMFIVSGESYISEPIDVSRGDYVEVRLPPNIDASGFFRRVRRD
jgi:hypothetical protein